MKLTLNAILCLSILLNSCQIGFDCELVDEFQDFSSTEMMTGANLELMFIEQPASILGAGYDTATYIINDAATYENWKAIADTSCLACNFPDIDFSTRTLIGKYQRLTCSEIPAVKIVKTGTTYQYLLKKIDNTQCLSASCPNFTFGWLTVPKMNTGDTIEFKTGKSYYKCNDC
jgi:hypothetical protein